MNVKKFRTTEEKQALMKGFLTSGKPRTVWCKETNIPVTAFVGWMKADEKAKKEVRFIPLKLKKKRVSIPLMSITQNQSPVSYWKLIPAKYMSQNTYPCLF